MKVFQFRENRLFELNFTSAPFPCSGYLNGDLIHFYNNEWSFILENEFDKKNPFKDTDFNLSKCYSVNNARINLIQSVIKAPSSVFLYIFMLISYMTNLFYSICLSIYIQYMASYRNLAEILKFQRFLYLEISKHNWITAHKTCHRDLKCKSWSDLHLSDLCQDTI